jgi:hypothetical protein
MFLFLEAAINEGFMAGAEVIGEGIAVLTSLVCLVVPVTIAIASFFMRSRIGVLIANIFLFYITLATVLFCLDSYPEKNFLEILNQSMWGGYVILWWSSAAVVLLVTIWVCALQPLRPAHGNDFTEQQCESNITVAEYSDGDSLTINRALTPTNPPQTESKVLDSIPLPQADQQLE